MAELRVVSTPHYQIDLTQVELEGLSAVLGSAVGENVLDKLGLRDLYLQIREHSIAASPIFRGVATL